MALYRLTDNVLVQDQASAFVASAPILWDSIESPLEYDPNRLGHVVNWFNGDEESRQMQAETARTMRVAARQTSGPAEEAPEFDCRLLACVERGQISTIPLGFRPTQPLSQSVLDVGAFGVSRPLPLLFDILEAGAGAADSEGFLIFSNADICLQPHFYSMVRALLAKGFDSLIINRRTLDPLSSYGAHPELAMMETGRSHPGLDCFVFPVPWVTQFARSNACIGAGWVMRSLLYNLVAKAKQMLILRDVNLTYHFGDDRSWESEALSDYVAFNLAEARSVLSRIAANEITRAVLEKFCLAHGEPLTP
jgi:hypothetical protein